MLASLTFCMNRCNPARGTIVAVLNEAFTLDSERHSSNNASVVSSNHTRRFYLRYGNLESIRLPDTNPTQTATARTTDSATFPWLPAAIKLGPNDYDMGQISEVVSDIDSQLRRGHFKQLSDALCTVPIDLVSTHLMVAVLRVMSPAKGEIPCWTSITSKVAADFRSRGLDATKKLRGLVY
jgi:hypothetical protein